MENVIPVNESKPKEEFKVIPVREVTRERLKNDMMKRDIYDSYINDKLDENERLKATVAELQRQIATFTKSE